MQASNPADEILLASRDLGDGARQTDLSVPGVHCAACIASVERTLSTLPGVEFARVNLSMKRATVELARGRRGPPDLIGALRAAGYDAHLFSTESDQRDPEYSRLIRALAVAGFSRDEHHAPVRIRVVGSRCGTRARPST